MYKIRSNVLINFGWRPSSLLVFALFAAAPLDALASGYQFGSQTVSGQGNADAGGAEANDATTVYYNPAGMSRLKSTEVDIGSTAAIPHSTYQDLGSTNFLGIGTGGTAAHDYTPSAVVAPSLYLVVPYDEKLAFGFGMFVPYGAKLDYGNTWSGRYSLTDISLKSVQLNPSVAYKLDDHHSFGFGISAQYMDARLGQAIDTPASVLALNGTPQGAQLIQQIIGAGGNPAALAKIDDGHATDAAKDWGYGFNLGYMYQLDDTTRFGLTYRSSITHKLTGDTVWNFSGVTSDPAVNAVLAAASGRVNSGAEIDLKTPETIGANAFRQFDEKWSGMIDLTWSRTSRLQNVDIQFPGTNEGNEVIRQDWKNTFRLSLGADYRYSDALLIRSGIAFDQSPVRNAQLTHPAFPDSDRWWYSFGFNYRFDNHSSIDAAYSFVDFKNVTAVYTNLCNPLNSNCTGNGETTFGQYKTNIQFAAISYNYRF